MPTTQSAHALGLDAGHAQEVLRVREVVGQLSKLGVQLCLNIKLLVYNLLGQTHRCSGEQNKKEPSKYQLPLFDSAPTGSHGLPLRLVGIHDACSMLENARPCTARLFSIFLLE